MRETPVGTTKNKNWAKNRQREEKQSIFKRSINKLEARSIEIIQFEEKYLNN